MRRFLLIFLALLLVIFAVSADTSNADVARIHVIANSDSEEDIAVKLKVAESVARLLSNKKFDSMQSIEEGLKESLSEITEISNKTLVDNGMDYFATAEVGVRHFDKKSLDGSGFPEGDYLALVVTLGEGKGHNWWSVMFPDVSLQASLAMGEEGSRGKSVVLGGKTIVKIRCLIFDLCNYVLTKR